MSQFLNLLILLEIGMGKASLPHELSKLLPITFHSREIMYLIVLHSWYILGGFGSFSVV